MDIVRVLQASDDLLAQLIGAQATTLFGAMADLAGRLPELDRALGAASDPSDLVARILASPADPAIVAAFSAIGAADLLSRIGALADAADQAIPANARTLACPVGRFGEVASPGGDGWPDGDNRGRIAWAKAGRLALPSARLPAVGATAGAVVDCEAGSLWFYPRDQLSSVGLVRLGVSGTLGVTLDGTLPFSAGAGLAIDAKAGANGHAHLFWRRPESEIFAAALAAISSRPVNIFSLSQMLSASARSEGFTGFVLALDGHASVDIELGLMREFDVSGLFQANVALTVGVEVKRKAKWELSGLRTATGFRLVLSHGRDDADGWGLGLGLAVDASALVQRIAPVLEAAHAHWDSVLDDIKPYLSPGTLLQLQAGAAFGALASKLRDAAGSQGLTAEMIDALERDLRLLAGGEPSQGVAHTLSQRLVAEIAATERILSDAAGTVATRAITRLRGKLPALLADPLADRLQREVEAQIAVLQGRFSATVQALADEKAAAVQAALAALGRKVSAAAGKADERMAAIRQIVEDADRLVQKVVAVAGDAAMAKISARLSIERQRVRQENYDLECEFSKVTPQTQAIYSALMHGRLQAITALTGADARPVDGLTIAHDRSSVRRFASTSRTIGYETVILGLQLTGTGQRSASADITLGLDGRVDVLATSAATRDVAGLRQQRSARLMHSYQLSLAGFAARRAQDNVAPASALDLVSSRTDRELGSGEVRTFLAGLQQTGMISASRRDAVVKAAGETTGLRTRSGSILVSMALTRGDMARLAALGRQLPESPKLDTGPASRLIFDTALDALVAAGEWKQPDLDWWIDKHMKASALPHGTIGATRRDIFFHDRSRDVPPLRTPVGNRMETVMPRSANGIARKDAVLALPGLIRQMAAIWYAIPARLGEAGAGLWSEDDYREASSAMARHAGKWLGTNQFALFLFGGKLDQRTLALMRALAVLSRGQPDPGETFDDMISLTLSHQGSDPRAF